MAQVVEIGRDLSTNPNTPRSGIMTNLKPLKNITTDDRSDLERIDPRTVSERYNNPRTAYWIGHTQVWQFPEGDAIAVVTNHCGEPCSAAITIRVGDNICTLPDPGGVVGAMRVMGLDPREYEVQ